MCTTITSFVVFVLFIGITHADASTYGLLRVGSLRKGASVVSSGSAEAGSTRALAQEDFQIMFRKLFSYESSGNESMVQLSMAPLSMAGLSTTPLSMVGLSMRSTFSQDQETVNEDSATAPQGRGNNKSDNNNDATIQGPGGNEGIQVNDGMNIGLSTGLMAAGFFLLVLAAVTVYKMKQYAALSQTLGDELPVPTAV